jgi:hypothetical protein
LIIRVSVGSERYYCVSELDKAIGNVKLGNVSSDKNTEAHNKFQKRLYEILVMHPALKKFQVFSHQKSKDLRLVQVL